MLSSEQRSKKKKNGTTYEMYFIYIATTLLDLMLAESYIPRHRLQLFTCFAEHFIFMKQKKMHWSLSEQLFFFAYETMVYDIAQFSPCFSGNVLQAHENTIRLLYAHRKLLLF